MPRNLPEIEYAENSETDKSILPFIDARNALYTIPYFKDEQYFANLESHQKFIKGVELLVRNSDRYAAYKSYLIGLGLNHCQVLENVENDVDCNIDMHHGPIFTLFDICCIMVNHFISMNWKISTFRIADAILDEHKLNNVQILMLSSSVHEQVHNRNIFIHPSQAFGNLPRFIHKYAASISPDLREKYNRYLDRAMMTESTTYGNLDLNKKLLEVIVSE